MNSARRLACLGLLALGCTSPKPGHKGTGLPADPDSGPPIGGASGAGGGRTPTGVVASDAGSDLASTDTAPGADTPPPADTALPADVLATPADTAAPADLAPPAPDLAPDARVVPTPAANRAFVTAATYTSNLGGLAGADAKCQKSAEAAGMTGKFLALLSTAGEGAFTRLGSSRGWVRSDGTPFGDTVADLIAGRIFYPLGLDELGQPYTGIYYAFTGTKEGGAPDVGRTSNDWAAPGAGCNVTVGMAIAGSSGWYSQTDQPCAYPYHLFCFEVGRSAVVSRPVPPAGARVAFRSKTVWNPSGGVASADALCGTEAQGAGLAGSYRAFLATSTASAVSRFDLTGAPWVRTDGVSLVATAADLAKGRVLAPLVLGADGKVPSDIHGAWTGAEEADKPGTENCRDWSSNDPGYFGWEGAATFGGSDWFANGRRRCDVTIYTGVYCFQR